MPLQKAQFDAIHTGRADPSRYLIIGFDTEYQRYADEDTLTLNNEVLSYQYCCTVIERDGVDTSDPIWSGQLLSLAHYHIHASTCRLIGFYFIFTLSILYRYFFDLIILYWIKSLVQSIASNHAFEVSK
jgi:hypothetical protein